MDVRKSQDELDMEDAFNSGNFGMSIPETPSADTPMDGESIVTEDATAEDVPEAMPEEVAPEDSPEVAAEAEAEGEPVAEESAEMAGDMPDEPAAEEVAEQAPEEVATPNTLEGAESWLEENLGPEVAAVFKTIAAGYAERAVAGVSGRVDEAISRIEDADMRGHFSAIKIKHPDFMDLSGSAEMGEWISAAEDAEDLKRIMDSGTADEVISMLDRYKAAQAEMDNPDVDADGAEGIRSTNAGMRLPERPSPLNDDFAGSFAEFASRG